MRGGSSGADLGLGPAQEERADHAGQRGAARGVVSALDGRGEPVAEVLPAPEQARRDHAHQAPQVAEVVLHGRAGERDAQLGVELADGPRPARERVLERLRLVEHHGREAHLRERLDVAHRHRVARHEHVACPPAGQQRGALGPAVQPRAQPRSELLGLVNPVLAHRGGRDHEGGTALLSREQDRQRLHGLAEPHVVGEARARAPRGQAHQPLVPLDLVGAQVGREPRRQGRVEAPRFVEAADDGAEARGGLEHAGVLDQLREEGDAGQGHLEPLPPRVDHVARREHAPAQILLQLGELARADADEAPAAPRSLQQDRERHGLAVDSTSPSTPNQSRLSVTRTRSSFAFTLPARTRRRSRRGHSTATCSPISRSVASRSSAAGSSRR